MRITIEIDANTVNKIQEFTGIQKKSPAIAQVLHDYCREKQKRQFLSKILSGKSDYSLTNDQLEELSNYDTD